MKTTTRRRGKKLKVRKKDPEKDAPDSVHEENVSVVALAVEPHDAAHVQLLHHGHVALGGEGKHAGGQLPPSVEEEKIGERRKTVEVGTSTINLV